MQIASLEQCLLAYLAVVQIVPPDEMFRPVGLNVHASLSAIGADKYKANQCDLVPLTSAFHFSFTNFALTNSHD
jgi:hypothetical protein